VPKISEAAKADRIEQILDGARRCFARHGYEGATVVRLEQEIGLSRGAIFNWFPKKEDIFLELATRDNGRFARTWVEQGLEATIRQLVEEDPHWLGVYLGVVNRLRTDTEFRKRWDARDTAGHEQALLERMRERQMAGELRSDVTPEEIGRFLGLVVDGIAIQRAAGYEPSVDVLLRLVNDALRPPA
jgi:AcrR family transcriptional regulator